MVDLSRVLFLDTEGPRDGGRISRVRLLRPGRAGLSLSPGPDLPRRVADYARGAEILCGHNLLRHDLPRMRDLCPDLAPLRLPLVDTLELSPLAFPRRPYHHLVKGYKLAADSRNDPVRDCELTEQLLRDEIAALAAAPPTLLRVYRRLFGGDDPAGRGHDRVFARAGAGPPAARGEIVGLLRVIGLPERACEPALRSVVARLPRGAGGADACKAFAYALAWVLVAEGDSILPPWVHHEYPAASMLIELLRDRDCGTCAWCRRAHDTSAHLRRFFGFASLRPAQEPVVEALVAGRNQLAILPTSGGKSLCFQLPAMIRALKRKQLSLVISPLQALMKDQVDVLKSRFLWPHVAALHGGLTAPERKEVRDGVVSGMYDLLYVAPEQLRNRSFLGLIRQREWGLWVVDEAHCISKWGHDFRPDYLYLPRVLHRFLAKEGRDLPQLAFFTATAKPEVVTEIREVFGGALGIDVAVRNHGVERENLTYEVLYAEEPEKPGRLVELVRDAGGAAIVYAATRRRTERFAAFLRDQGIAADHYHAGRIKDKRDIQDAFVRGELDCVVATNAFGMGVDKADVRLVVHLDMPGSLESYLQEAGRAGRDGEPARCVLLFHRGDVDQQFRRDRDGRLTREDLAAVYRALRARDRRTGGTGEVVMTAAEILRMPEAESRIELADRSYDTKVRVAISMLEESGLVERRENRIRFWKVVFRFRTMEEARDRLARLGLDSRVRAAREALLSHLFEVALEGASSFDIDAVSDATGIAARDLPAHLHALTEAGLLEASVRMSAVFAQNIAGNARVRFERLVSRQREIVAALEEECPDAEPGRAWSLGLRRLCTTVRDRLDDPKHRPTPEDVLDAIDDFAREGLLRYRKRTKNELKVALRSPLADWREPLERRDRIAASILDLLHSKADPAARSRDVRVQFGLAEILDPPAAIAGLFRVRPAPEEVEPALLFLHRNRVIFLENGLAMFRSSMRIRLVPGRGLRDLDATPLLEHYRQKTAQVHVMAEYGRRGREGRSDPRYVRDYFELPMRAFLDRYFPGRKAETAREVSPELYRRIVTDLGNAAEERIVKTRRSACLVLAGPGSGKTRTIIHRVAYLVGVRQVPPGRILVVAYNRQAVLQLRRGLRDLLGAAGAGVDIHTFHGLALNLTGTDFDRAAEGGADPFAAMIEEAIRLLDPDDGEAGAEWDEDERRARVLRGYEHILVDEYQDIDERQYRLVSLIAARGRRRSGGAVKLMAVGDDDQNIYAFRESSVAHMRRFQEDYGSEPVFLVENYRSTRNIVAVTNHLIEHNRERMKTAETRVRVNAAREGDPDGDPVAVVEVRDAEEQARAVAAAIRELRDRPDGPRFGGIGVLGRTHDDLRPVLAVLAAAGIPRRTFRPPGYPLVAVREVHRLIEHLRSLPPKVRPAAELLRGVARHLEEHLVDDRHRGRLFHALASFRRTYEGVEVTPAVLVEHLFDLSRRGSGTLVPADEVVVSTMHAAKGLEFDAVFLLAGRAPEKPGEEEDERRLDYVAATRARRFLVLLRMSGANRRRFADLSDVEEGRIERRPARIPDDLRSLAVREDCREEVLSLADVWIAFPARGKRAGACQERLARLPVGAPLRVRRWEGDGAVRYYLHHRGERIARLSREKTRELEADAGWTVVSARAHAVVRCRRGPADAGVEEESYWTVVPELTLRRR